MSTSNQSTGQTTHGQVPKEVQPRTIEQVRKEGLNQAMIQKIQQDKAEMDRLEKEQAERIHGNYISFKEDKETKSILFTGKYQKLDVPAKDFATGLVIPNKTVTKWRWECYDTTNPNNVSHTSIWERGWQQSQQVMHFLGQNKTELVIVRNGVRGSNTTTYLIYPI